MSVQQAKEISKKEAYVGISQETETQNASDCLWLGDTKNLSLTQRKFIVIKALR